VRVFAANAANTGGNALDRALEQLWQLQDFSRTGIEDRRNTAKNRPLVFLP